MWSGAPFVAANRAPLAASPWHFGLIDEIAAPHLDLGLFQIVVTVCLQTATARVADSGTRFTVSCTQPAQTVIRTAWLATIRGAST
jgi:hypothetical protein